MLHNNIIVLFLHCIPHEKKEKKIPVHIMALSTQIPQALLCLAFHSLKQTNTKQDVHGTV